VELSRNNKITQFRLYFPGVSFIFHPKNEQEIFVPGGEFRLWKFLHGIWDLDFSRGGFFSNSGLRQFIKWKFCTCKSMMEIINSNVP
jgi:hypothetical protein